jgi:nitrogen fixation protein NifU and related proteins
VYSETLLDHFQNPRNVGELEDADASAEEENPVCGDRLRVWLRVEDGRIAEMRWKADGCAPAIAAASAASELVVGMVLAEARSVDRERITQALGGLPPRKAHAAILAAVAVQRALARLNTHDAGT